jgi:UDP-glucose 4-epimerase
MRVLVTGGAGFLGFHVVTALLEHGCEVAVIDNMATGKPENVPAEARLVISDIRAPLDRLLTEIRPEVVVHLAAHVSVPNSVSDPRYDLSVNVDGTVNVVSTAARAGARKVIFVSSAAVYGVPERLPISEDSPTVPVAPYGLSKLTAERYVALLHRLTGIAHTVFRPANLYGPVQTTEGEGAVVPAFVRGFLAGKDPVIHGDGGQTRDFIHVSDMARAIVSATERGDGQTLNVGGGMPTTIGDLWRMVADLLGWSRPPVYVGQRQGDIRHSVLDSNRARISLNWAPKVSMSDGLRDTVAWWHNPLTRQVESSRPVYRNDSPPAAQG